MPSTICKNELPFSKKLADNLDYIHERVFAKNKAGMIIIDGGVGEGKTTLGVHIVDYLNQKKGMPLLDLKELDQLAMGGTDFAKKLLICNAKSFPIILYDEAGDFNKRGSLTRFNALINRTFETYRAFKVIVVLLLPSFSVIDNDLFDKSIPRLLLHVHSRSEKQGSGDGFSLYRMFYIREKMKKLIVKPQAYKIVEPNFYFHFKDLEPVRSRLLDLASTRGKIKELKHAEIRFEGLVSYSDIAKKVNRSEIWVKQILKAMKIKPERRFERRFYFHQSTTDRVLDFLDDGGTLKLKKKESED
jgi:hypothetical protein